MAGNDPNFGTTYVRANNEMVSGQVATIGFYGKNLKMHNGCFAGLSSGFLLKSHEDTCDIPIILSSSSGAPNASIHKIRLLLAEDNYVNQALIMQALDKEKYIIDGVANGQEALHAAKTLNYDIVLMDIRMPIMGGIESATTTCALDGPAANTPIIALTANSMQGDKEKYLECGMDDYLAQSLDLKALRTLVQKWSDKASQSNVSSLLPEQSALSA